MDLGLLLAAAGLIFAGIVKGSIGFGLPMIAAPVLAGFVGPRTAVVVMSIVNLFTAVMVAGRVRGVPIRSYSGLLAPLALALAVGVILGAQLLASLSPALLSTLVGLTAVLFAVLSVAQVDPRVPAKHRGVVGMLVGLGAGLLAGTTSISATPITIYLHALGLAKRDFLVLLNLMLAVVSTIQIGAYVQLGLYTAPVLGASALTVLCVAVGIGLGFIVQDRIDQRRFNRVVIAVIFLIGLSLLVSAFGAAKGEG